MAMKVAAARTVGAGAPKEGDQVFTVAGIGNFNVGAILRAWDERPGDFEPCRTDLTKEFVDYIWRQNDPDRAHLAAMTRADVDRGFAVAIEMPDGTMQIVDGNHYVLKAWELGEREMRLVIVPKGQVERFKYEYEVQREPGAAWERVSPEEVLSLIQGTYARRDGTLRDAEGRVLARHGNVSRETSADGRGTS